MKTGRPWLRLVCAVLVVALAAALVAPARADAMDPLTIVAMDGANWLAHYADHRVDALWRFHALHHSQEELSVLTSFRAHPLMHTTGFLLATIPVVALMPARPIAPVLITIYVCIGTLQHANLRWTFGPAGRVIVSPAYHRRHHATDNQGVNLGNLDKGPLFEQGQEVLKRIEDKNKIVHKRFRQVVMFPPPPYWLVDVYQERKPKELKKLMEEIHSRQEAIYKKVQPAAHRFELKKS